MFVVSFSVPDIVPLWVLFFAKALLSSGREEIFFFLVGSVS